MHSGLFTICEIGQPLLLAEYRRRGLPVFPGFVVQEAPAVGPPQGAGDGLGLEQQVVELEQQMGRRFGASPPLLLTVSASPRAGGIAPALLAGIGLNSHTLPLLEEEIGRRAAACACLDLVATWRAVVEGDGPPSPPVPWDRPPLEGDEAALAQLAREALAWLSGRLGDPGWFDTLPSTQLVQAVQRVSSSCGFPVLVRAMPLSYGDARCGCGTVSTRLRENGEQQVSGSLALGHCLDATVPTGFARLSMPAYARQDPAAYSALQDLATKLEHVVGDMVEFDFVVTFGALWITDVREASRAPRAAIRVAVDLAEHGVIPPARALERVTPEMVEQCFDPHLSPRDRHHALAGGALLAKGQPLSRGAACGVLVADPAEAERRSSMGQPVIFACSVLTVWQSSLLERCAGLIALASDEDSCAARVARLWSIPSVGSCESLSIDATGALCTPGQRGVRTGEPVTIDGNRGEILAAALPVLRLGAPEPPLRRLLAWADQAARPRVWVVASSAQVVAAGRSVGAEGVVVDPLATLLGSPETARLLEAAVVAGLEGEELQGDKVLALRSLLEDEVRQVVSEMQGFPTLVTVSPVPLRSVAAACCSSGGSSLLSRLPGSLLDISLSRLFMSRPALLGFFAGVVFDMAAGLEAHGLVIDLGIAVPGLETAKQARQVRALLDGHCASASLVHDVPATYRLGAWLDLPANLLQAGSLAQETDFALFDWTALARRLFGLDPTGASLLGEPVPAEAPVEASSALTSLMESAVQAWRSARPGALLAMVPGRLPPTEASRLTHRLGLDGVACHLSQVPATRLACGRPPT